MKKIKFSHNYTKLKLLDNPTHAKLIQLFNVAYDELSEDLLKYDTAYPGGYYPLPSGGEYLLLIFLSPKGLFTTIRRYTPEKHEYYKSSVGETFEVIVNDTETK